MPQPLSVMMLDHQMAAHAQCLQGQRLYQLELAKDMLLLQGAFHPDSCSRPGGSSIRLHQAP